MIGPGLDKSLAATTRHMTEQSVDELVTAYRLPARAKTSGVWRESPETCDRWRNQLGGLKEHGTKPFRGLEPGRAAFKQLLADAELAKAALKQIAKSGFQACS